MVPGWCRCRQPARPNEPTDPCCRPWTSPSLPNSLDEGRAHVVHVAEVEGVVGLGLHSDAADATGLRVAKGVVVAISSVEGARFCVGLGNTIGPSFCLVD